MFSLSLNYSVVINLQTLPFKRNSFKKGYPVFPKQLGNFRISTLIKYLKKGCYLEILDGWKVDTYTFQEVNYILLFAVECQSVSLANFFIFSQ